MKKILCLIDSLGTGGAERQIMGLTMLLKGKGYSVDLATYIPHNYHSVLKDIYGLSSITLTPKPTPLGKLNAVKHLIKQNQYDTVIAYKDGPSIITSILKLFGGRFNLIVSERNTTQILNKKERLKFFVYRAANYIVPNSYSQEQFIKSHYKNLLHKTITVTNYTDTNLFRPVNHSEGDVLEILTVARIGHQKNVLRYLDAIKRLKDEGIKVRFVWYGNTQIKEDGYKTECLKKISSHGIGDMVCFKPGTTQIVEVYNQYDVFCLPSLYEGYPNVVCEAMSCGMPVLCSDICDNASIVKNEANGFLFDPNNVEDIASKIKQMIELNKDERQKMRIRSREIAEELFSMETFVEKYIKLIEE